jgi:tricarballylate dehydrogenase
VLVVGGGNAALCAALAASDSGARVMLLERAPLEDRGGNSKYTRNIRVAHASSAEMPLAYEAADMLEDLQSVTGTDIDLQLAGLAVRESQGVSRWMEEHGIRWQPALRGTLQLERTNRFFLGGGKALVNTYFAQAARRGVEVRYDHRVESVEPTAAGPLAATVRSPMGIDTIAARAVVVASGGFESNLAWLEEHWGEPARNYIVRGTSYNDGLLLTNLFALGALERGTARSFHAVACDARSPRYDGGIVTRVDCIPYGVVVNRDGERFADEGEDIWPKRYATWGQLVAAQPGQVAYAIHDDRARGRYIPSIYPAFGAPTIGELAGLLGLDRDRLTETIAGFNRSIPELSDLDLSRLDGRGTKALTVPKSNWAAPIDSPPFWGYPLRPGITFTYLGLAIDGSARVLNRDGAVMPGLFAAGEVMAGNILRKGYLAGFGMTIGTVFGRLAGREAAIHARTA